MSISQDFIDAVTDNDVMMVRIMLKDSLVVDPTFKEFDEMLLYAEEQLNDLYDEHDGEVFINDISKWNKAYMDEQMVKAVSDFSKERVAFLKNICRHLYSNRAEKIENDRIKERTQTSHITQKQVGTGLAVAGTVTAVAGIVVSKPIVVGVGVAAVVAGGILIATDK